MKKIKLGIIGTGLAYKKLHLPQLKKLEDKFEIIALCDINLEKAKDEAKKIQLNEKYVYSDYNEMLKISDLDAVVSLVPINLNYQVAVDVIKANKHLFAEKPLASTLDSCYEIIKLIKNSNLCILLAENSRYDEENIIIKNTIESKLLGDVMYFIDNNLTDFPASTKEKDSFATSEWRQKADFKGGIFLDSGVHQMARLRYFFGEMKQVFAVGKKTDEEFCEYCKINAVFYFENEISGHYGYFNMLKETQKPMVGLRIFLTEGEIYLEDRKSGVISITYKNGTNKIINFIPEKGYFNEWIDFYYSIEQQKKPLYTPDNEIEDIKDIFTTIKSIEDCTSINF